MEPIEEKILNLALKVARVAGDHIEAHRGTDLRIDFKGTVNLVTRMDRKSEEMICSTVSEHFPGHAIIAEEGKMKETASEWTWVIDPLDGTTNYAHGLPVYCVSIGVLLRGAPHLAVVHAPALGETFHAVAGKGAFLNGHPISVSTRSRPEHCLLATGFPYDRQEFTERYVRYFSHFLSRVRDIRRCGAAALDLSYVAAGRFDGFWEFGLLPWDTAAGSLLIMEAGGRISDFSSEGFDPFLPQCLASNGRIHEWMRAAFA